MKEKEEREGGERGQREESGDINQEPQLAKRKSIEAKKMQNEARKNKNNSKPEGAGGGYYLRDVTVHIQAFRHQ